MDAFSDPSVHTIVGMLASQVGKTESGVNNPVGYYIDQDPCPILVTQPTLEIARAWSKDRLAPMLRDTPCLKRQFRYKTRVSENTILHRMFLGGHITIAGANSPASLTGRPIRILLMDEIDRYPFSAGAEGDPCYLAEKRTTTFWNRKIAMFSTPTIRGMSRIEMAYESSDKRKFYLPCPHCNEFQILEWAQCKWPKDAPSEAYYECKFCGNIITESDKIHMLKFGEWRAEKPQNGVAGFWLNELYSPWVSFANMATRFIRAQKDPEQLKVFVNTALAETWEEGEAIKDTAISSRCERYGPNIPVNVVILTAGVDIQGDRIETEVVGWGVGQESWGIERKFFYGDPARQQVWKDFDEYLQKLWKHEYGIYLPVSAVCIDTGFMTQQAYVFVKTRQSRYVHGHLQRIFAVKGSGAAMKPFLSRASKNNVAKINLFILGVNTAKDTIHAWLKIDKPGHCYMHFPFEYNEDFFKQLTSEVRIYRKGVRIWEKKAGAKNEALDCRIYSMAALGLINANLEKLAVSLQEKTRDFKKQQEQQEENRSVPIPKQVPLRKSRRGGWVYGWRK